MKLRSNFAIIATVFGSALIPLTGQAQDILLNIGDSTYPTATAPTNYVYDAAQKGVTLTLDPSDTVSTYAPLYNKTLAAGSYAFSGGQTITLSTSFGTYAKNTVPGDEPDGLMDLYLYNSTATANTLNIGNLNLQASSTYMLYVYGWIPSSGTSENGLFTPLNDNADISYSSTASASGFLAVQFTTSASYVDTDTLDFTWARAGSTGDGVLNGLAIVQVPEPNGLALSLAGGVAMMGLTVFRRKR